jgi:predicted alpha/beta superfamily hydrolase
MSWGRVQPSDDEIPATAATAVTGVLRLHELRSRIFRNTRLLRVWLPPDYDRSGARKYPVLYLNDGQNLFEAATAFAGVPWAVGETAGRLISEGRIVPLIIVGMDNTGKDRVREYIPYRSLDPRVLRPKGERYPEFLRREVMPLIEERYPVAKGPEYTGLGGSSLGGLITLYTHMAMPGVFGRLLIESPSLFVANRKILSVCSHCHEWPDRMFVGIGTRETGVQAKDEKAVSDVRRLESILHADGLDTTRLRLWIEEGATHSESAWAARFSTALEFLFRW